MSLMRRWTIEADETYSAGRCEVTSDVLAAELGVPVHQVEGGTVEEVQALIDEEPEGFWEWATRYGEISCASATVREDVKDPMSLLVLVDCGEVVLATSGHRSWLLCLVAEQIRSRGQARGLWTHRSGVSAEDLINLWERQPDCSVTLEEVVDPAPSRLILSRRRGWSVRVRAQEGCVRLTVEEMAQVLDISAEVLATMSTEAVRHALAVRAGGQKVSALARSALTPQVSAVEAFGPPA